MNDEINHKNGVVPSAANPLGCNKSDSEDYTSSTGAITGDYPCYSTFYQGFGSPIFAIATMDTGVFAQDNRKFSPRLTIELGLRWDKEALPPPSANLTTAVGSFLPYNGLNNTPSDNHEFGPRVGFSYDLYGKGETVLRGGYGIYYGRITNGNLENIRLGTGTVVS
jgi:outer membrane receptor protein involved in Fe transport